jgi:NAD+ kinase
VKKIATSIRRVGLIANPEKPDVVRLVHRAQRLVAAARRTAVFETNTAAMLGMPVKKACSMPELAANTDVILVFGGDGTMLKAAREIAGSATPVLGINAGHLGFLTAVSPNHLQAALHRLWEGRFQVEERALLEGVVCHGGDHSSLLALNDFVLSRGLTSRLIELEVRVNDVLLTRYRCDGFIASSPTGSTAYSLAAGGAIVSPDTEALTLTPICPHTLSIRPVVVNLASTVEVKLVSSRLLATVAADGQQQVELAVGDTVTIRRSARSVRMLQLEGSNFFSTLRLKLGWSGSNL